MDRRILLVGLGTLLLLTIVITSVILFAGSDQLRGTYFAQPYPVAAEIKLARADGSNFKLSDLRGNLVLLFFGYTSCPDVCPTTLAQLKLALEALEPSQAEQVKVLLVTVDPGQDSPERVQEYVNHFNPSFIGFSGTEAQLATVWSDYGIFREIVKDNSAAGYSIEHTARVTLIDRNGSLRDSFPTDAPLEDIVHDIKLLLKE